MSALSAALGPGGLRSLLPGRAAARAAESVSSSLSAPVRTLTPPSQLSDAELLDGCLAGSRLMQKYLYERFAGRMMAVCLRYAQTTFEAEDVLQEGFLTVFKNLAASAANARWNSGFGALW